MGGVSLFLNNMLTAVPKHKLSFLMLGIETINGDIFSDCEVKMVVMVYRIAPKISINNQ